MPLVHDPAERKLGRQTPPIVDPRTVRLARAFATGAELPPAKKSLKLSKAVDSWPMLKNDDLGDCVPAGMLHKIQLDRALNGRPWTPSDDDAIAVYEQVAGYKPSDPSTDSGTDELVAMKTWHKGLRLADGSTERILGFAAVDPKNAEHIKIAMDLFGGLTTGIGLPVTAQRQKVWKVVSTTGDGAPNSWGGHCTLAIDFNARGVTQVTWGGLVAMSWAFLGTYCDQLFAAITQDGVDKAGAYRGIDEKVLLRDLGLI